MDWLLLWWLMSDDRYDEPEHPRYFREPKPRELTSATWIGNGAAATAMSIYQNDTMT